MLDALNIPVDKKEIIARILVKIGRLNDYGLTKVEGYTDCLFTMPQYSPPLKSQSAAM